MIFQTNNENVVNIYNKNHNIKIVDHKNLDTQFCAIYFSSHNIYYPNSLEEFKNKIEIKDHYEWYGTRVSYAAKHIFVRDIKKQWYISGINKNVNTLTKLVKFLRRITKGYKVICIGSSAGGYAAIIIGNMLNAHKVFCFNGQMQLNSLVDSRSSYDVDPYVFKYSNNLNINKYYSVKEFISPKTKNYYFVSMFNDWDYEQLEHIKDTDIHIIKFKSSRHGIPFIKSSLTDVISSEDTKMRQFIEKEFGILDFSIKFSGYFKTIIGVLYQMKVLLMRFSNIKRSKS